MFNTRFEEIKNEYIGCDGVYSSDPVSLESIEFAKKFIKTIPEKYKISDGDIGCDPDGAINIEWFVSKEQTLSISFEKNNIIAYAYLIANDHNYGNIIFGDVFPQLFSDIIDKFKRM